MKKKQGGHTTGFWSGPGHSAGSGLVFEVRRALGFSQPEMAEKLGCSMSTISRVERQGVSKFQNQAVQRNLEVMARRAKVEL